MTFLPIVVRELRMAARRKATYYSRALVVLCFLAVATPLVLFYVMAGTLPGKLILAELGALALLYCHIEAVRKTADCISEEKREGTLGLLFLTDLKGYDIVLGKLAATSLNSLYGLLAILPLLGLATLLGGVTGQDFQRVMLALVNVLFLSLSAGMFVSCACREKAEAKRLTILILVALNLIPALAPSPAIRLLSPALLLDAALDGITGIGTPHYIAAMCVVNLMGWLALGSAALWVPHCWQEQNKAGTPSRWRFASWAREKAPKGIRAR